MVGSPDSGAPYTAEKPERPPFMPGPAYAPEMDHKP